MPYRLKIKFGEASLKRIVTGLRRAHQEEVLDATNLTPFARQSLQYLKGIFPSSRRSSQSNSSKNEFGYHLVNGWRSSPVIAATVRGFEFTHIGARNARIRQVLEALDKGTGAYDYVAQDSFSFLGKKRGSKYKWTHIAEGDVVHHEPRKGSDYTNRTIDFIRTQMLPQIRTKIETSVRKAVANE